MYSQKSLWRKWEFDLFFDNLTGERGNYGSRDPFALLLLLPVNTEKEDDKKIGYKVKFDSETLKYKIIDESDKPEEEAIEYEIEYNLETSEINIVDESSQE